MSDKIHLSVVRKGDSFVVVDQDGREVEKQKDVRVIASTDEATEVELSFLDSSLENGAAHTNRRKG